MNSSSERWYFRKSGALFEKRSFFSFNCITLRNIKFLSFQKVYTLLGIALAHEAVSLNDGPLWYTDTLILAPVTLQFETSSSQLRETLFLLIVHLVFFQRKARSKVYL